MIRRPKRLVPKRGWAQALDKKGRSRLREGVERKRGGQRYGYEDLRQSDVAGVSGDVVRKGARRAFRTCRCALGQTEGPKLSRRQSQRQGTGLLRRRAETVRIVGYQSLYSQEVRHRRALPDQHRRRSPRLAVDAVGRDGGRTSGPARGYGEVRFWLGCGNCSGGR